ncbi:MAG: alpha/beta hydrolase, partial [Cyclobacteriaceae bacterium]|nr:alpha/beta hydrolase [Cyclobacteriaceae bacterium]
KDLEIYYAEECYDENDIRCEARKLIRKRLIKVLAKYKGDDIFLIGHSMGSIIAYDVLTFLAPDINIRTFVTMGSPLGFPVVQGKIATEWHAKRLVPPRLRTPPRVKKHWYNFADLNDKVALIYQLSKNFKANWRGIRPKDFVVHNDYQIENSFNPHKSFGYLRTPEFSKVLHEFSVEESFTKKVLSRFYSIFQK